MSAQEPAAGAKAQGRPSPRRHVREAWHGSCSMRVEGKRLRRREYGRSHAGRCALRLPAGGGLWCRRSEGVTLRLCVRGSAAQAVRRHALPAARLAIDHECPSSINGQSDAVARVYILELWGDESILDGTPS